MWYLIGLGAAGLFWYVKNQSIPDPATDGALALGNEVLAAVEDKVGAVTGAWERFDDLFIKYAQIYGLDPNWLKAFALNESDLGRDKSVAAGLDNPDDVAGSTSSDGKSWGLMQVTLSTGRDYDPDVTPQKLNDPNYSVDLAAHLISDLMRAFPPDQHPRNLEWMVKSYNQGRGNTNKEIAGLIGGYAGDYWTRWQSNYQRTLNTGSLS